MRSDIERSLPGIQVIFEGNSQTTAKESAPAPWFLYSDGESCDHVH